MPVPSINVLGAPNDLATLANEVAKFQKELKYLLTKGLDTANVNELNAEVINAGVLNANLVTIRSDLSGAAFIQLDGNGIEINNGIRTTFEVNLDGMAYFGGNVTSDAVITGALIQTAVTGRRIVLYQSALQSLDTETRDGFTLDGADGFFKFFTAGVETGGFYRNVDSITGKESLLISHNIDVLISGLSSVTISTPSLILGDFGADVYLAGAAYSLGITQADSGAIDVPGLRSDFNQLLSNLRLMGILS